MAVQRNESPPGYHRAYISFEVENSSNQWQTWNMSGGRPMRVIDSEGFEHIGNVLAVDGHQFYVPFPPRTKLPFAASASLPEARQLRAIKLGIGDQDLNRGGGLVVPITPALSNTPAFDPVQQIEAGAKVLPITVECPRVARYELSEVVERDGGVIALRLSITNLGGQTFQPGTRDFHGLAIAHSGVFAFSEIAFQLLGQRGVTVNIAPGRTVAGELISPAPGYVEGGPGVPMPGAQRVVRPILVGFCAPFGAPIPARTAQAATCGFGYVSTLLS